MMFFFIVISTAISGAPSGNTVDLALLLLCCDCVLKAHAAVTEVMAGGMGAADPTYMWPDAHGSMLGVSNMTAIDCRT